ncbi:transmembrane protein 243-like [Antedon mediterranea]|uniref:transmembrane protein 243-like n=1 Tax=Antedon mediterranea TaxID=105859 RepID=UPI003AF9D49E
MSYYDTDVQTPLFGEPQTRDRAVNLALGVVTGVAVLVTLVSAIVYPWPPLGINIYLAVVIVCICIGNMILIYWYRKGDVDPKFRSLIYFNAFTLVLLCISANLYFHELKF